MMKMKINELLKILKSKEKKKNSGISKIFKKSTTIQNIKYFFCKIPTFFFFNVFTVISKRWLLIDP